MSRLLGMIMESLVETPDPSMMEMTQRDDMSADKMAMESLGGIGELPETGEAEPVVESYEPEVRIMNAADALAAIESNIEVKTGLPVEMNDPESIFKALESELPTDKAPYDPSAELDDIAKVLAGLDADDDMSPDQPQPDEKVESDMDVGNLINENQDKEEVEDSGRIDHATEGVIATLKQKHELAKKANAMFQQPDKVINELIKREYPIDKSQSAIDYLKDEYCRTDNDHSKYPSELKMIHGYPIVISYDDTGKIRWYHYMEGDAKHSVAELFNEKSFVNLLDHDSLYKK